jgi:glutaredoxin
VKVYSREGCHLCDDAIAIVADVCSDLGASFEVVDVDGDPSLKAQFHDDVPVVQVDGQTVGFWRIKPEALRTALGA